MTNQSTYQFQNINFDEQMFGQSGEFDISRVFSTMDSPNPVSVTDSTASSGTIVATDGPIDQAQFNDPFTLLGTQNNFEQLMAPAQPESEKTTPGESPDPIYISPIMSVSSSPQQVGPTDPLKEIYTEIHQNISHNQEPTEEPQQIQQPIAVIDNIPFNDINFFQPFGSTSADFSDNLQTELPDDFLQNFYLPNNSEMLNFPILEEFTIPLVNNQTLDSTTIVEPIDQSTAVSYISETTPVAQPMVPITFPEPQPVAELIVESPTQLITQEIFENTMSEQETSLTENNVIPVSTTPTSVVAQMFPQKQVDFSFSSFTQNFIPICTLETSTYNFNFSRFTTFSNFERELKRSIRRPGESAKEFDIKLKKFVTDQLQVFSYHHSYLVLNSPAHKKLCDEIDSFIGKSLPTKIINLQNKLKERVAKSRTYKAKLEWALKWIFYLERLNSICHRERKQGLFGPSYITAYKTINQLFVEVDKEIFIKTNEMEEVTRTFDYYKLVVAVA
ncbi:uncharacterized protein SAPINGB_P005321 [Magnusiomyces paraingens]|uniref:Uncharacterized protein n=1 Tax=Magnusiomyces paraingens TaxID=2606893 RepID=A0A5E8BZG3_9ASCO|nr:uncharacterized protein SAPINGB_P005321 [Saprochaete ingens]VVT56834.1 unnamed protein product [Saprochaete ingens]